MYVWFIGLNHSKYRVLFRVVYSGITTFESKEASPTIIRRTISSSTSMREGFEDLVAGLVCSFNESMIQRF